MDEEAIQKFNDDRVKRKETNFRNKNLKKQKLSNLSSPSGHTSFKNKSNKHVEKGSNANAKIPEKDAHRNTTMSENSFKSGGVPSQSKPDIVGASQVVPPFSPEQLVMFQQFQAFQKMMQIQPDKPLPHMQVGQAPPVQTRPPTSSGSLRGKRSQKGLFVTGRGNFFGGNRGGRKQFQR